MTDAFDADVLIYAADLGHPLGGRVRALLEGPTVATEGPVGIGSVLLLPEVLSKAGKPGHESEAVALSGLLGRLDLQPVSLAVAKLASALRATHGLKTPDAVHLATALRSGADRFITNNRRDFSSSIEEIDIVYPDDLPDPEA